MGLNKIYYCHSFCLFLFFSFNVATDKILNYIYGSHIDQRSSRDWEYQSE